MSEERLLKWRKDDGDFYADSILAATKGHADYTIALGTWEESGQTPCLWAVLGDGIPRLTAWVNSAPFSDIEAAIAWCEAHERAIRDANPGPLGEIKREVDRQRIDFIDRCGSQCNIATNHPNVIGIGACGYPRIVFSRSQALSLAAHLQAWLETGSMELEP